MTAGDGSGVGAGAALEVILGNLAASVNKLASATSRVDDLYQNLRVVPIVFQPLGANVSGTMDTPDRNGPKDGFFWDVRRLTAWGFTAGTVTVTLNDINGEQVAVFPQAGQFTWSGNLILAQRDRLIAVSAGITGNVQLQGQAIEVSTQIMPEYLL